MNKLEESIETLLRQEKALLDIIKQVPKNEVQKAVIVNGICELKRVSELLDVLTPERKGNEQ